MRNYIYILAILTLLQNWTGAQNNLPLKFKDEVIIWSELNWIAGNSKEDQIFQNRIPPIIIEDTLYTFSNYQGILNTGGSLGYSGFIIKKINKTTGQLYWQILRSYKEFKNRKVLSQADIKDGILNTTLYDEGSLGSGGTDWYNCYPAHFTIDKNKGMIIDSNFVYVSNSTLPKFISIAGSEGQNIITNPRFYLKDFGYIYREFSTGDLAFLDTKIDFKGVIIGHDTTKLVFKYYPEDFRFFDNPDRTIGALLISESDNWQNREMKYLKYDENLDLIKSVDLSHHFTDTITYFDLYRADQGYIITVTSFDDFSTQTATYTYHLFDPDGNLVDKLIYSLRSGTDNGIVYGWLYPLVDVVNKQLLLTHSRQNKITESTFYEIYTSDGDTIQRIKRIEVEGIKDHFRTQYATMLKNGDILLYVEQFANNDPAAAPRWYSWIMLDGQKMNITSSTTNEVSSLNKLKIYPNPTTGIISISGLDQEAKE